MKQARRMGFGGLAAALVVILAAAFCGIAFGGEAGEKPTWQWSEKFPKPSWWRWDEAYYPEKPVRGGIYRAAAARYIGLMNPNHWPVNDWVSMGLFYEKLVYTDGQYKPTVPWLASSWEYTDPVTVVMKLRKGVSFHDGSPFNAEAIKYQIDWIMNKKNGCWSRSWLEPVKSIEVVDNYTVRWHFKRPWGAFLGIIANVPGYVISAKALKNDDLLREVKETKAAARKAKRMADRMEKRAKTAASKGKEEAEKAATRARAARQKATELEKKVKELAEKAKGVVSLDVHAVGSGPYIIDEAKPGNYLKSKRNPNWWFGRSIGKPDMPYYDGIKTMVIPEPSVRLANLKAGKIESLHIDKSQYPQVKDDPNLQVWITPGNHIVGLRFNLAQGPCKDIRVRKAISHAIDRKALIAGTQFGFGIPASCNYPSVHWAHNPELKPVKYDPELSRKLLAEAGYKDGLKIRGYMGNDPSSVKVGQAIKAMLARVGIDWKIRSVDPVSGSDMMRNLEYDLASGGWAWIYDPDLLATGLYHPDGGFNYGRSHNEKAIELIMAGRREVDQEKRQKIYWELEKVLYDNYEDVWLWWYVGIDATRKVVRGYNREMSLAGKEGYAWSHPTWFKEGHP